MIRFNLIVKISPHSLKLDFNCFIKTMVPVSQQIIGYKNMWQKHTDAIIKNDLGALLFLNLGMDMCMWVQLPVEELELQLIMISLIWALGTEPRSSGKAARVLNHGAISPAPKKMILKNDIFPIIINVQVFGNWKRLRLQIQEMYKDSTQRELTRSTNPDSTYS